MKTNFDNDIWRVHPRPQMRREHYFLLNGTWMLNRKRIKIPYPPESWPSAFIGKTEDELVYGVVFELPKTFPNQKILLHFGAVDHTTEVFMNKHFVGRHTGGYLPFSMDVTNEVSIIGLNTMKVVAEDFLNKAYPYGKQSLSPSGMWYSSISGIWQPVWFESVPDKYIRDIRITPNLTGVDISLDMDMTGFTVVVELENGNTYTQTFDKTSGRIELAGSCDDSGHPITPIHWTPDTPHLYDVTITAGEDTIKSYFALRTIEIKNINGINRVCLNGNPIFLHGVLDQGYFMDGIYIPRLPEGYAKDIMSMKELGFNTLRKHIKIEPEQFYYECDRLGMLVVQDMVSSGKYSFFKDTLLPNLGFKKRDDTKYEDREHERKGFFEEHMVDTINHLYNHPCIIAYTLFNEGWGQFESDRLYDIAKSFDSTRLYDSTSGWFAQKKSDFDSEHVYFRNKKLVPKERPLFLSECGGYSLEITKHLFNPVRKRYGYGRCKNSKELTERIIKMYKKMVIPIIKDGLCGCIYTQLCDVENEINGLYTYDREYCKIKKDTLIELSKLIYETLENSVTTTTNQTR